MAMKFMININMRCIEISGLILSVLFPLVININMRCIEIFRPLTVKFVGDWLTLTWDVLK